VKLKLDENIGRRGIELLTASGHDVTTVWDQGLRGVTDETLFEICASEGRVLVTLDRDFGEVRRFPPENSAGIAILELGPDGTLCALLGRLTALRNCWRAAPLRAHCGSSSRDACASTCVRDES
jgi:hypothetical protein